MAADELQLEFHPVTPDRWNDLEALFGRRGAMGGCWCMWWRVTRAEFEAQKGAGNRQALKAIVEEGRAPGLLAYQRGEPVGWVSIAPREEFGVLQRSRTLKPVDDLPVWAIPCFFIRRDHRGQGMSARLIEAAVEYARSQGASLVEGYPVEPQVDAVPDLYAYTGFVSTFVQAGFAEVARRSERRPIMRRSLGEP